MKLAQYIKKGRGTALFIFDEPTTGLHFDDIRTLLLSFNRLIEAGNTLVIIEHNMDVVKCADYIIDLGPEGGQNGGYIVAAGTPEEVAQCGHSHTGYFLREYLNEEVKMPPMLPQVKEEREVVDGDTIKIVGAREHNLRDITLSIPRNKLVTITGLSGSGKSTLAFDIIFAEGQRRYLECLSSYIRQYLKILDRPHVDLVSGIPPTVAIEQRTSQGGKRSTVSTMTEIYHYLRLLYSKLGTQYCPKCGGEIAPHPFDGIVDEILKNYKGMELTVLAPIISGRKGFHHEVLERIRRANYMEARIDGYIECLDPLPILSRYREHDIEALVGRLRTEPGCRSFLAETVKKGLALGNGTIYILDAGGNERVFSERLFCPRCQIGFEDLDPGLFSFNSRYGACSHCQGLGSLSDFADDLVLPDLERSLNGGALFPFEEGALRRQKSKVLNEIRGKINISLDRPLAEFGNEVKEKILHGGNGFQGVIPILRQMLQYINGNGLLKHLYSFMSENVCPICGGRRLNANALAVRVKEWGIGDLVSLSAREAGKVISGLRFNGAEMTIAEGIINEVMVRLRFLNKVGLSYLALNRRGDTLSGGEAQRIRLAAQLGSNLRGICYVLDEPTIGLHPRDDLVLLSALDEIKDRDNTIIIVEHDEETIRRSDYIIDLGPGGGKHGGNVVASGSVQNIMRSSDSITGAYLRSDRPKEITSRHRSAIDGQWLKVLGACEHNLKKIDVELPLGSLIAVTGVSGSGKSTLLRGTIYSGLRNLLGRTKMKTGAYDAIMGWGYVDRVLEVDHSPIGKTPRSTPATYIGLFDDIRRLFALTPEARSRGYGPGRFSFNMKGGRCEECMGQGKIKTQMQFLPDVYVDCDVCLGSRYNEETLSVSYKGKNIYDVLEMTFEEGLEFFSSIPRLKKPLQMMVDIGLGYVTFGQSSPTLSGGEAQRVKLVSELCKPSRGKTFFILDEPTTGLHIADVERLLYVLQKLVDMGNTVTVIEHNREVIKEADYIIDLGPEGGDGGGYIVAQGTPEEILEHRKKSYTAKFLYNYVFS